MCGLRRALLLLTLPVAGCGGAAESPPAAAPVGDGTGRAIVAPANSADAAADAPRRVIRPPQPRGRWATARVTARAALRAAPGGRALGRIGPRTQFGGPRVVSVLGRRGGWLRVVVPERPNARPAWIAVAAAREGATDVSLHIDRSDRMLVVRDRNRVVQRVAIGVGAPGHPTPTGRFAVTDKLEMGGPGTTYGCCAIALSAHQPHLPADWPGLDRIAVHGTQSPATIGTAASLGCMHAGERDLRRLMRTVPVGAPVFIRA